MTRTRKVLLIVTIVSMLIAGSALLFTSMGPTVAQETETPQLAPLNPDFVDYMENPPEPFYGYIPPPVDLSHLDEIPVARMEALTELPSRFDWRDTGKVTPVKDQHPCGTCWIHGTIAAIESRVLIVDGVGYDFSEQNVACCTDPSWVYLAGNRCGGGGWSWLATDVLTKKGTRLESCDPYNTDTINTESCDDTCTTIKRVTGYRLVADSPSQIDEVKNAIYNYGPVSMAFYYDDAHFNPTTDIYYWPNCPRGPNHLVSIVGWDDNIPHPAGGGSGAWIVKNSWGTDWGDNGYFYLCYGSGNMQEVASYRYQDYYPDETIYYWDEAGIVGGVGYKNDSSAWMASVFTSNQSGYLTHVDFWTTSNNAQYELYVYDGSFGSLLAYQTGTCNELGYYSIPLDTPVWVTAGQQFTVTVKMTTPGYNYPLPVEYLISGLVEPPIQSGVCYVRHYDGASWADAAASGVNFCLRAKIGIPDIGLISPIDFGDVEVGVSLDKTTTIYNEGSATLNINSITRISGDSDFTHIGPSTPFAIGEGGSQEITIRFAPSSTGSKSATFNVSSNDPDEPDVTFSVLGNGISPDIGPISPIDFGDVLVGTALDKTTTIYNEGSATLNINSIDRVSGSVDFTYIGPSTPFDIAAYGSQEITIQFAPSSTGSKDATFNVNSNDPDEPDVTFSVSGNGAQPDVNGDGRVNVLDMILVGQHYGETGPPGWTREDVNWDGAINDLDMTVIAKYWTG